MKKSDSKKNSMRAEPHLTEGPQFQAFGTVVKMPNGLAETVCRQSVSVLNQLLADTITLRDLYKKHHWQVAGPNFYAYHQMFDKHYEGQAELVDAIAERIQLLGGVSVAMAPDVAKMTKIEPPPAGREDPEDQLSRLVKAHETILKKAHSGADQADELGDHGTNDLLASKVIPANEFQVWFVSQHLVQTSKGLKRQSAA